MNITVFGATGQVGKKIVAQGLAKGYTVTAFGRNVESLLDKDAREERFHAIKGYVFDAPEVYNAVRNADAVLSVLGGAFDGADKSRSLGIKNIIQQMEKTGVKRIVALGGMGVLNAPDGGYLIDTPGYDEQYKPVGKEHLEAYLYLKGSSLDWSFVCAPDILDAEVTGKYITCADYAPEPNHYQVTAGDLAHFMLNEVTAGEYIHHRVGISRL